LWSGCRTIRFGASLILKVFSWRSCCCTYCGQSECFGYGDLAVCSRKGRICGTLVQSLIQSVVQNPITRNDTTLLLCIYISSPYQQPIDSSTNPPAPYSVILADKCQTPPLTSPPYPRRVPQTMTALLRKRHSMATTMPPSPISAFQKPRFGPQIRPSPSSPAKQPCGPSRKR